MAYEPTGIHKQFWEIVGPLQREGLERRATNAFIDEDVAFDQILQTRPDELIRAEYLGNVASLVLMDALDDGRREAALIMAQHSCGSVAVGSAILAETRRRLAGIC